jgi:hypothetical protein
MRDLNVANGEIQEQQTRPSGKYSSCDHRSGSFYWTGKEASRYVTLPTAQKSAHSDANFSVSYLACVLSLSRRFPYMTVQQRVHPGHPYVMITHWQETPLAVHFSIVLLSVISPIEVRPL